MSRTLLVKNFDSVDVKRC